MTSSRCRALEREELHTLFLTIRGGYKLNGLQQSFFFAVGGDIIKTEWSKELRTRPKDVKKVDIEIFFGTAYLRKVASC